MTYLLHRKQVMHLLMRNYWRERFNQLLIVIWIWSQKNRLQKNQQQGNQQQLRFDPKLNISQAKSQMKFRLKSCFPCTITMWHSYFTEKFQTVQNLPLSKLAELRIWILASTTMQLSKLYDTLWPVGHRRNESAGWSRINSKAMNKIY